MDKKVRTWFYIDKPNIFDVSPCDCGNVDTEWSEFQECIWCPICNKDFIPDSFGILESPVPMQVAKMMGITFTKYDLITKSYYMLDEEFEYQKVFTFLEFDIEKRIPIVFKSIFDSSRKFDAFLCYKDFIEQELLEIQPNKKFGDGTYRAQFFIQNKSIYSFLLTLNVVGGNLELIKDEHYKLFVKSLSVFILENELINTKPNSSTVKI